MSIKAMSMVWERSKQSGSALLMLLAIADYAKDDGTDAWPSLATLARKTRMTRRNAIEIVKKLEADGELKVRRGAGPRGCNFYDILFPDEVQFTTKQPKKKVVKPSSPGVVNRDSLEVVNPSSPVLVNPTSPEPSCNHHLSVKEPLERENPSLREQAQTGEMTSETELSLLCGFGRDGKAGVADPSQDGAQFIKYGDEAVQAFIDNGGDMGRLQNERDARRDAIVNFCASQPEFDLGQWINSVNTCIVIGGVQPDNLGCIFDTYRDGGDFQEMQKTKRNGGKHASSNNRRTQRGVPEYSVADPAGFHDQSQDDAGA